VVSLQSSFIGITTLVSRVDMVVVNLCGVLIKTAASTVVFWVLSKNVVTLLQSHRAQVLCSCQELLKTCIELETSSLPHGHESTHGR
jgi:hypothetical protein